MINRMSDAIKKYLLAAICVCFQINSVVVVRFEQIPNLFLYGMFFRNELYTKTARAIGRHTASESEISDCSPIQKHVFEQKYENPKRFS